MPPLETCSCTSLALAGALAHGRVTSAERKRHDRQPRRLTSGRCLVRAPSARPPPGPCELRSPPLRDLDVRRRAAVAAKGAVKLVARADVELGEDLSQVVLDGAAADEQPRADLGVREAVAGEPGDLGLLRCEVAPRFRR